MTLITCKYIGCIYNLQNQVLENTCTVRVYIHGDAYSILFYPYYIPIPLIYTCQCQIRVLALSLTAMKHESESLEVGNIPSVPRKTFVTFNMT